MILMENYWFVLFAVLGLVFGSFGTVLVSRIPARQHIGGRSRCPGCKHVLGAAELIPVCSFLLLGGRCRHCRKAISPFYPVMEMTSALLFLVAFFIDRAPLPSLLLAFSLWLMLLIAVIDARTKTIHDVLNLSFIVFSVAHAVTMGQWRVDGALLFILFFGAQWLVSRGKWVGSGDILFGAGIGFLLGGWERALLCLGLAYILGATVASSLLLLKKASRKSHIPFGPFLAAATVITLLIGEQFLMVLI